MIRQTTTGKAFEINKDSNIYGTFAEIGAGQETVNFFYRAGLASQTVAKSMSAYDMTMSDEIYGKQERYVCKDRLINMLNHEYRLLEKRLKKKHGDKTCFFVFATTAVTSTQSSNSIFSNNQHAWMGIRFQAEPKGKLNNIMFHVNCFDKSRLQQYESLGILGVNLIYASFYHKNNPKKFIQSLTENLSGSRLEIHGMSCTGPNLERFSHPVLNLELLSQKLSSLACFADTKSSAFLSDVVFNKTPIILYGKESLVKQFKQNKSECLKDLNLTEKNTVVMNFIPKSQFTVAGFKSYNFPILISEDQALEDLKKRISLYSLKPLIFVVDKNHFQKKLFNNSFYKQKYLLKSLGELFENQTKLVVLNSSKNFSVKTYELKDNQTLKNYLVENKQILDLHCKA